MKTSYKTVKILAQIFLFIFIINDSFCYDQMALTKKNIYSSLRSLNYDDLTDTITDEETTEETTEENTDETKNTDGITSAPSPSDYIKTDQPRPIDTSEVTSSPTSSINGTNNDAHHHKSSSGLSVGAICAIAIPTIAALLGVAAAAALCKGGAVAPPVFTPPALPPPNYIDTSLEKFNVVHELPPQQPLPQVQPVHIEPQPLPQVVRPVYPINRVEPPLVNRAFEPMYNIQQPMQMVPVQQVQMVPVQQVEMVPVEEVVPVQQVFQPVEEHIQQYQQVRQVHQELIPERIETLPSITPADEGPIIQQTAETLPNLGPVNNFQLIQQTQESLPNIGPVNDALGQQGPSIGNSTGLGFSVQNLI